MFSFSSPKVSQDLQQQTMADQLTFHALMTQVLLTIVVIENLGTWVAVSFSTAEPSRDPHRHILLYGPGSAYDGGDGKLRNMGVLLKHHLGQLGPAAGGELE